MRHLRCIRGMVVGTSLLVGGPSFAQQSAATDPPSVEAVMRGLWDRPVTVRLDNAQVKMAVDAIATSAGVRIQYRGPLLDAIAAHITLHAVQMPLQVALARVLAGTHLEAVPLADDIITIKPMVRASDLLGGNITGRVVDAKTQRPLRGATVLLDDATRGVVTGEDGTFRFVGIDVGSHRVMVRLLGYAREIRTVTVSDAETTTFEATLTASVNTLDQVVVTGTVIPTELKAVPNAITVITAKDIEQRGITQIDQLFRGEVPGVFALNQGANTPFNQVLMFSRGATALSNVSVGTNNGTNPIKTYIDGVELSDPQYLSQIDPRSIERIEILTGPQASTIYGSNAINGVMQIFTKRGMSSTPQLTLNLLSGLVENNFSLAYTPQHDYSAQLSGVEGHMSYDVGSSWHYIGAWTPAKQSAVTSGFGGVRLSLPTARGPITTDVSLRRANTQTKRRGVAFQGQPAYEETGWYQITNGISLTQPTTYTLDGQTLGLTLGYTPTGWWSHEIGFGQDVSNSERRVIARGYRDISDTTVLIEQTNTNRRSLRYVTTVHAFLTLHAQSTVTLGADAWQNLASYLYANSQTLTGALTGSTIITRQPGHNTGTFLQAQVSIAGQLFLTYGLRAEWNPTFGADAQPNYAPRYGAAYTRETETALGSVTTKLRASYGRSTRPPAPTLKLAQTITQQGSSDFVPGFGNFDYNLANPNLVPEHQQGGEGGLEVYFGTRSSLVITRYNQTVSGLISQVQVDSARSIIPNPTVYGIPCSTWVSWGSNICTSQDIAGFGYTPQLQYVNLASIRNQGWELQGSVNTGPFITKGTYSWTKSRTIGVDPKYRAFFENDPFQQYRQYRPGATFQFLPEHTWAIDMTYAQAKATVALNISGTGQLRNLQNGNKGRNLTPSIRLMQNRFNVGSNNYISFDQGYGLVDLQASYRLSSRVESIVDVKNLANRYTNDYGSNYATIGRQGKVGLRIRL